MHQPLGHVLLPPRNGKAPGCVCVAIPGPLRFGLGGADRVVRLNFHDPGSIRRGRFDGNDIDEKARPLLVSLTARVQPHAFAGRTVDLPGSSDRVIVGGLLRCQSDCRSRLLLAGPNPSHRSGQCDKPIRIAMILETGIAAARSFDYDIASDFFGARTAWVKREHR